MLILLVCMVGFWIRVGISYRPLVCGRAHSGHSSCLALGPSKILQRLYCRTMANDEELSQALSASCFERLTSPFHIHIDRGAFLWFFHFLTQLAREWNLRAAGHVIQNPSMKGYLFQFLLGVPRPYSKKNHMQKNSSMRRNIPRPYSMRRKHAGSQPLSETRKRCMAKRIYFTKVVPYVSFWTEAFPRANPNANKIDFFAGAFPCG